MALTLLSTTVPVDWETAMQFIDSNLAAVAVDATYKFTVVRTGQVDTKNLLTYHVAIVFESL